MGKLRQGVAMAIAYEPDPARALDAVDYQLRIRESAEIATAFIGIIDPKNRTMRYASAGHPPPLLRRGSELIELHAAGLPIGLREFDCEQSRSVSLDGAQLLLLYTDGLTEATRDVTFGERRLQQIASSDAILFVHNAAEFLCDACLPLDAQDDTAVLTVSFGKRAHWSFDAENAQAAHDARSEFVAELRAHSVAGSDVDAAELIFGELVGNVVRHAPGPIDVQMEWTGEHPVLHVTDRGKGFIRNPALPIDPLSESGRGLYIISLLARNVRVERIPGYGNHIAVELPVRALPQQHETGQTRQTD
jgi:anti-sigma regulatory factor (Ser/Thr protein kinase)